MQEEKLPIETAFEEGVAMFRHKYGSSPESAHISRPVVRAVMRLFKKRYGVPKNRMELSMCNLPLFELKPPSPNFEIHMIKPVRKEDGTLDYWVQKMKLEPKWVHEGQLATVGTDTLQIEGYEYDSEEEAEWLTSESELNIPSETKDKLKRKILDGSGKQTGKAS